MVHLFVFEQPSAKVDHTATSDLPVDSEGSYSSTVRIGSCRLTMQHLDWTGCHINWFLGENRFQFIHIIFQKWTWNTKHSYHNLQKVSHPVKITLKKMALKKLDERKKKKVRSAHLINVQLALFSTEKTPVFTGCWVVITSKIPSVQQDAVSKY